MRQKGKHRLDPSRITQTAENLALRVSEGLPESTLAGLAVELAGVARATEERTRQASRPIYALRAASLLAIGASFSGLWYLVDHIHARWEFGTIPEVFESADAGFNLLLLLAGALRFLITLEARVDARGHSRSSGSCAEFIHVIDVTQLYFTPDLYKVAPAASRSSMNLDYTYLLFCTQMLAVISNLAPLYTRLSGRLDLARQPMSKCWRMPSESSSLPKRKRFACCLERIENQGMSRMPGPSSIGRSNARPQPSVALPPDSTRS